MLGRVMNPWLASFTHDQLQASGNFDLSLPVDQRDFEDRTFGSCPGRDPLVVISVPNDDEIYIGIERVTLSELSTYLTYKLNGQHPCKEIYVKTSDFVKYHTFASIIDRIREVSKGRIWYVKNKNKEIKHAKSN